MSTRRSVLLSILVVALLVWGSLPAFAQKITGDIVGTVTDATGAVVPNASVTAENVGTKVSRSTTSSATGDYSILELAPGLYKVTVSAQGFKTAVRDAEVSIGLTTHADFILQVLSLIHI